MQHADFDIGRLIALMEGAFGGLWGAELRLGDAQQTVRRVVLASRPDPTVVAPGDALMTLADLPRAGNSSPLSLTARLGAACVAQGAAWLSLGNLPYDPPGGALDRWCGRRDLGPTEPLLPPPPRATVAVYVPPEALDAVRAAVWDAGAGIIGAYDSCSFAHEGTGTYRPLAGADPYRGQRGRVEAASELRLEFQSSPERLDGVLAAMLAAHPYEEVAYSVVTPCPLPAKGRGSGRVAGDLALYAGDADAALVSLAARRGARRLLAFSADRAARASALDRGVELATLPADEVEGDALAFLAERLQSHLPPSATLVRY